MKQNYARIENCTRLPMRSDQSQYQYSYLVRQDIVVAKIEISIRMPIRSTQLQYQYNYLVRQDIVIDNYKVAGKLKISAGIVIHFVVDIMIVVFHFSNLSVSRYLCVTLYFHLVLCVFRIQREIA